MPRITYKCSTCKVKHSPPTGKQCSRRTGPQPTHGSTTLMSIPDDSLIAHDPQHGIDHGHTCNLKSSCHNTSNHGQSCGVKSKNGKKITVAWPQDLAFVGALRKRPSYEELKKRETYA